MKKMGRFIGLTGVTGFNTVWLGMMRRASLGLFLFLAAAVSLEAASARLRNALAVVVNQGVITRQDVAMATAPVLDLLRRQYGHDPSLLQQKIEEAQREELNRLVERKLILREFETAGFNLPETIIEEEIERRIRERYGDRPTLIKSLKREGRTFESFRQEVREQIIVSQMRAHHINDDVIVSPYKIERYYLNHLDQFEVEDEVRLRMIYLDKQEAGSEERALEMGEEILTKIRGGASFAEMAAVYSEGSQRREGGDWGWIERDVLREDLAEIAFSMDPGDAPRVVNQSEGVYIMQVTGKRPSRVRPLSEVRDAIENTFRTRELERRREQWVSRLKEKSFVRYF